MEVYIQGIIFENVVARLQPFCLMLAVFARTKSNTILNCFTESPPGHWVSRYEINEYILKYHEAEILNQTSDSTDCESRIL